MTVGLILAVLALIISAIVWALGANSSNPHLAGRGKLGVLVALGAAIITGASVALVNFFWNVGQPSDRPPREENRDGRRMRRTGDLRRLRHRRRRRRPAW